MLLLAWLACADPDDTADTSGDTDTSDTSVDTADTADTSPDTADTTDTSDTACTPSDWYADADGDGYGDPDEVTSACEPPEGTVANGSDCDDASAATHPDAPVVCWNQVDEDCSGACELVTVIPGGKGIVRQGEAMVSHSDLDADGVPDLVVGRWADAGVSGTVSVYWGPVHADMTAPDVLLTGSAEQGFGMGVVADDLDGDGQADLASLSYDNVWYVWTGPLAAGSFPADSAPATLVGPRREGIVPTLSSATGDLDGDGVPELLMGTDPYYGGTVYLVNGGWTGEIGLEASATITVSPGAGLDALGLGQQGGQDLDGDGVADLVVGAETNYNAGLFGYVGVLFGPLSGALTTDSADCVLSVSGSAGRYFGETVRALPDLDGDGLADLLVSDNPALAIFSGLSAGTFGRSDAAVVIDDVLLNDYDFDVSTAGDFDGDGWRDVLIGCPGCGRDDLGEVRVFRGPLAGTLTDTDAAATISGSEDYIELGTMVDVVPGTPDQAVITAADYPGEPNNDGAIYLFTGL